MTTATNAPARLDPGLGFLVVAVPSVALLAVVQAQPWLLGWQALVALAAGALLEAFPAKMGQYASASLHSVAVLVGVLVGGAPLAVCVAVGAAIATVPAMQRGDRWMKGSYNLGMLILAASTTAAVFALASGSPTGPLDEIGVGWWVLALAAAEVARFFVNVALLSLVVGRTSGATVGQAFVGMSRGGGWSEGFQLAFALVAFVVIRSAGPVALVLLLVPLAAARQSMLGVQRQREALDRVVRALVRLVEVKDGYTRGHAERVADLADRVALRLGVSDEERYWLRIGAVLHDVGKIAVPLGVLCKAGPLDDVELTAMRRHPDLGADLIEGIEELAPAVPLVRQHHERIDGRGYPRGLAGDELPLTTRIVSAVDAWDAMTTTRPYRSALDDEIAVAELRANAGAQFDPRVVQALIAEVAPDAVVAPRAVPAGARRTASAGA